jgi:hypothetical protein
MEEHIHIPAILVKLSLEVIPQFHSLQQVSWLTGNTAHHAFSDPPTVLRISPLSSVQEPMAYCNVLPVYSDRVAQASHLIPF